MAERGFRREMKFRDIQLRFRAAEHLVPTLSDMGVLVSKRDWRLAKKDWAGAAALYKSIHPYAHLITNGDTLFVRHAYAAAFRAYRNSIFPAGQNPMLNPQELDAGDLGPIKNGLDVAAAGRFNNAASIFATSPTSQAAKFLEAQVRFAAGQRVGAYKAYVEALMIAPPTTSDDEPSIGPYSYEVWLRLIAS